MGSYLGKRLLHFAWIMLAVSFLTFLLSYLSPGDAAMKKLNAQGIAVSEEVLEKTRENMGLNRPFIVQYGDWALHALRFDLGTSYKDGFSVSEKLVKGLKNTAMLTMSAILLALLISLPLAVLCALKKDSWMDHLIRLLSFIGNSLPNFLISVLLIYYLCVKAKLLPVVANQSLRGLILPCMALAIPICSRFIRQIRAELLEQLSKPYVTGARARGVKGRYVLWNVLHNASISILTIVGLSIGMLLGGSVVIETIFRWPGLGKLAMDAITNRDYPVIQGFVLFTSAIYVVVNLITDVSYRLIDPRLREREDK
ncbi:MAG: ABC transporter permease [Lachnospiraceae bacterium]|nr:ABC transporter permease [Lachnospiraceae bacterium]MBR3509934.1 ABC transporter permease [Lachnospiraceae bacterium]MBR4606886.1 ABC transporter permease [Lachnospiraceae bacterium]MBR6151120.1 ABC transporter permease [Lachnospiraceae bacterium]